MMRSEVCLLSGSLTHRPKRAGARLDRPGGLSYEMLLNFAMDGVVGQEQNYRADYSHQQAV